jgi:DNA-binding NarL/FixJ family response regulator
VAILDDSERFRKQLVERLGFYPEVAVAFDSGSATDFLARVAGADTPPDVALLDIELSASSGIEVASRLTAENPTIGILMFTVFEAEETVLAAIQAGASGYLLKDASAAAIVQAVREVHEGGVPLSRSVARHLLGMVGGRPATPPLPAPGAAADELTAREVELLEQIVLGETEHVIAARLRISPHTVRTHVKNIYRKLRVRSRAAAVRQAYQRHLLQHPPGPPR